MERGRHIQSSQRERTALSFGWSVCIFWGFFTGLAACTTPKEITETIFTDGSAEEPAIEISSPDEQRPEPWFSYDAHGDCFGRLDCDPVTGVVTRWEHNPVPIGQACASWVVYTCKKGCRKDGKRADFMGPPEAACEEARPKVAGDSCEDLQNCLPSESTYDPATQAVINTYLRCDISQKVCVKADPPVVEGYLTSCRLLASKKLEDTYGYRESSFCRHGLCLLAGGTDFCVFQGCTIACDGDHQCPQGSSCRTDLRNLTAQPTRPVVGVCKPKFSFAGEKKGLSCN